MTFKCLVIYPVFAFLWARPDVLLAVRSTTTLACPEQMSVSFVAWHYPQHLRENQTDYWEGADTCLVAGYAVCERSCPFHALRSLVLIQGIKDEC